MKNTPRVFATPNNSMPEATAVSFSWDTTSSSSIHSLSLTVSDWCHDVHVKYESNPKVTYLYKLGQEDAYYIMALFGQTDSFGATMSLVKKVAKRVSKHEDGFCTLLTTTPMPLSEAVSA